MKVSYKTAMPKDKSYLKVAFAKGSRTELIQKGSQKVLTLGYAKDKELDLRKLRLMIRQAVVEAKKAKIKKVALLLSELRSLASELNDVELGEMLAKEITLAAYEFRTYKSKPKEGFNDVTEVAVVASGKDKVTKELRDGVSFGLVVGEEVTRARELSNIPGGEMTPELLAKAAKSAAKEAGEIKVTIFDEKRLAKEGMGAILGVGKGSEAPPRLIMMEYQGGAKDDRPIVLVGKGITYDSGGINMKPSKGGSLNEMHMDMSGGAAVIATMAAVSKLGLQQNVIGFVPAAENMVDGASYRPGDIVKSYSGKTIEIGNTDAEGRVVMADALSYAAQFNPSLVIDVATLTGAALVALGEEASAIFTKDGGLVVQTMELGEMTGDYVWPLPLWDEFDVEVKSNIADVTNSSKKHPYGGASAAAAFLKQFTTDYAKDCSWMHIDMAPTMAAKSDEFLSPGAKGAPVHLLVRLIEEN